MKLSLYQKTLYLMIFNSTMISRSIGTTFKDRFKGNRTKAKNELKNLKKDVFKEIKGLIRSMDKGNITERKIWNSINRLSTKFKISVGQAQKPINTILKFHYHFFVKRKQKTKIGKVLHCPIDSAKREDPNRAGKSLASICEKQYKEIQNKIENDKRFKTKVEMDKNWDKEYLRRHGWLK